MSLTVLPRSWSALCEPLLTAIDERRNLTLAGLYGPAKGLVLAALASSRAAAGPPLLVVVPNQDLADELYGDVLFFQGLLGHRKNPPSLFPDWGILPYAPTPPPVEVIGKRMQVLDLIQRGESNMVIAPVQAFLQRLLPSERLAEASFTLTPAQTIERAEFVGRLLRLGYRQVSAVQDPGQFSIRGGITDLFMTRLIGSSFSAMPSKRCAVSTLPRRNHPDGRPLCACCPRGSISWNAGPRRRPFRRTPNGVVPPSILRWRP